MSDDEDNEFGAQPEALAPVDVGPFPRMRPSPKLDELWKSEVARHNETEKRRYELAGPLDLVPSLIKKRSLPSMWWPAPWVEFARRCRTYVGECIGVTGAIGGGKTSFALQVGIANTGHGMPVLWVPLELDGEQVDLRMVANSYAANMSTVREQWTEARIRHALTAVHDMWRFVDHFDEPEEQFQAIEDAIVIAWKVYRMPPVVVVDHLGELVAEERDDRAALRRWAHRFRKLALRRDCYIILLNQVSKANQAVTTGKIEIESATDALGLEMGSQAIASGVSNNIVLAVFKKDDTEILDGHALVAKARNTGIEGRIGMRFRKAGGVWSELDYLPATPAQERAAIEADKKDKHRAGPPRAPAQARADINAARAGDAAAGRRARIMQVVTRHGMIGIDYFQLRKQPGVGTGALFAQAVQELLRAGTIERLSNQRLRAVTRIE